MSSTASGRPADHFNLQRFVNAQNPVFAQVLSELRAGRKTSHWMWFVFPQIQGLGLSATSREFAISSLEEAQAYLAHPILGPRLVECCQLVLQIEGKSGRQIFGSPDDVKFHSSLTLFAETGPDSGAFQSALDKYFAGVPDPLTLRHV
jgi:uncharacterized protein (DUF1810 family)